MGSLVEKYKEKLINTLAYNFLIRVGDYVYRRYGFNNDALETTRSWRLAAAQATNIAQQSVKNFDLEKRLIKSIPKTKAERQFFNRLPKVVRFKLLALFATKALSSFVVGDDEPCCTRTKFLCEKLLKSLAGDNTNTVDLYMATNLITTDLFSSHPTGWFLPNMADYIFDLSMLSSTKHSCFALADIYRQLSFVDMEFKFIEGANYEI